MNSRAFTLSLVIAGIAIFIVYSYIEGKESKLKQEYGNDVPVVVAKTDIKELELIDDRKLQIITVPEKYKMPGSFNKVEELYNTIASVPIKEGEQITKPRVSYPGQRSGLSRQVRLGKRALAIPVSEEQAVSRLIKPGDRVDVLTMMDYAGGKIEQRKVVTVLQDVYILATGIKVTQELPLVGYKIDKEIRGINLNHYSDFNTVTLELTPFEVQKVIFLLKGGGSGLYLSLRNNDDNVIEKINATRLYDVLGEDAQDAKKFFLEQAQNRGRR